MAKHKVKVYQDTVNEDGTIDSGPEMAEFWVNSIDEIKVQLQIRFGGVWNACADGKDGAYESSAGGYGPCLVSKVIEYRPK